MIVKFLNVVIIVLSCLYSGSQPAARGPKMACQASQSGHRPPKNFKNICTKTAKLPILTG